MERDFLFGILAVQLGFVEPPQLMAAASAWLGDPSKSLQDRLVAGGVLDLERRKLLEALVTEALKHAAGDPAKAVKTLGGEPAILRSYGSTLCLDNQGNVTVCSSQPATPAAVPYADTLPRHSDSRSRRDSVDFGADTSSVTAEHPERYVTRGSTRVDAELGRGGLGRVFLAFDRHVGRDVAVKELLCDVSTSLDGAVGSDGNAMVTRFLREARVTGQLEHPNIVPVYEVGRRADGTYYYSMRVVRGKTLGEKLRRCRTAADRLGLLNHYVNLCNAIAYAHSRGVIHRDIKPENVMVGEFGETVVLDWGIAKVRGKKDIRGEDLARELELINDADNSCTLDGSAIGTPAYMSPEQAEGHISDIDERSDVWGLGAVLYEILTGCPPFQAMTPIQVLVQVRRDTVEPVRRRTPDAPAELAAVAEKALQRNRHDRYPTAKELSDEVEAFLHGRRVGAYSYSSWELARRFFAKNTVLSLGILAVLVTVIASSLAIFVAWGREQRARAAADEQRRQAVDNAHQASANLAQAYVNKAEQLIRSREFSLAFLYAAAASREVERFGIPLDNAQRVALDSALYESRVRRSWTALRSFALPGQLRAADFSPDGRLLAVSSSDWDVFVVAVDGSRQPVRRRLGSSALAMRFTPDGADLVAVCDDGFLRVLDSDDLSDRSSTDLQAGALASAFISPDTARLAVTSSRDDTSWLIQRSAPCARVAIGKTYSADFSADGARVACVNREGKVELRNAASGALEQTVAAPGIALDGVTFSWDGKRLLARGGKELLVIDARDSTRLARLAGLAEYTETMRFSRDDKVVLALTTKGLSAWDARDSHPSELIWNGSGGWDITVSRSGDLVATAGHGALRVWRKRSHDYTVGAASSRPMQLSWSPDARWAAVAEYGGAVSLVDPRTGHATPLGRHAGLDTGVFGFTSFSPTGDRVASIGHDMSLKVFRCDPPAEIASAMLSPVKWEYGGGPTLSFSPDGAHLAVSTTDGRIRILSADTLQLERFLDGALRHPMPVRFSRNGRWLAAGDMYGSMAWWNAQDWHRHKVVVTPRGSLVADVIFAQADNIIIAAGDDGWISRWNAETGALEGDWRGHEGWVNRLSLSKDGTLLLTGSDDGSAKVWDAATGELRRVLRFPGEVAAAAFSPDGVWLAAGWENGVDFLPLPSGDERGDAAKLFELAAAESGRTLDGFGARAVTEPAADTVLPSHEPQPGMLRAALAPMGNAKAAAVPGATLELLRKDDHSQFSPPLTGEAVFDGTATVPLPRDSTPFIGRITVGNSVTFASPDMLADRSAADARFSYLPPAFLDTRASRVGIRLNPARGHVLGRVRWGGPDGWSGVGCARVSDDARSRVVYLMDVPPYVDSSLVATTYDGYFVLFNVEPGAHELFAEVDGWRGQTSALVPSGATIAATIDIDSARVQANPTPAKCLADWPGTPEH